MDALIKDTYTFVLGACVEWNWQTRLYSDMSSREFLDFVSRTHMVVYRCIRGQLDIDEPCSDLEFLLSLRASHIFKK